MSQPMTSEGTSVAVPSIGEPTVHHMPITHNPTESPDSSAANSSAEDGVAISRLQRPKLSTRKSSGTMIVPRETVTVDVQADYDDGDVRSMSPRRSTVEIERLGKDARKGLVEQAKTLQASLLAIVDRVETVKEEHEKLEGGNKFLQSYIGELMQTSRITSSAPPKTKGKARSGK